MSRVRSEATSVKMKHLSDCRAVHFSKISKIKIPIPSSLCSTQFVGMLKSFVNGDEEHQPGTRGQKKQNRSSTNEEGGEGGGEQLYFQENAVSHGFRVLGQLTEL